VQEVKETLSSKLSELAAFKKGTLKEAGKRVDKGLKEYNDFVTRLQSLGLEIDPREALQIAYKYPPNNLNAEQLKGILPVLFAISQRTHFQYLTPEITKTFSGDISQIFEPYRKEGKSVIKTNVGNFNATISYGCMELSRGKVFTMVKTRWSKAEFFCDDFPK
jgi:hypothetical protein